MTTSPQRNGRPRVAGARRTPSTSSKRTAARPAIQLANVSETNGQLTLLTTSGVAVLVARQPVAESLRYMMAWLRLSDGVDLPERLGVTSTITGEGATYLARSMALVLANDAARRVCLVDLNWWSPSTWPEDLVDQSGIADVVRGNTPLEHAIISTGNPGLSVLPAGATTPSERPLLGHHPELDKILIELTESFDHVLIDLPAVRATSEALRLAEAARTVIVVVNQGVTPEDQVKATIDQLGGVQLLGLILNRGSTKIPRMIRRRIPGASTLVG
jgi:Mrp family chromosome partitioning ATPase